MPMERAFVAVCDSCLNEGEPLLWKSQIKQGSIREATVGLPDEDPGWVREGRKVYCPQCAEPEDRL